MLTDRPWDLSYQQPLYKDEWWGLVWDLGSRHSMMQKMQLSTG
jgi:hypothetical protein